MKYDTIIIGAGMSGLAAGIRLAHYEKKVLVCERHFREGGLNSFYHRHGVTLETGLHAMTNFAAKGANKNLPLMKLLRQLRIPHEMLQLREQNGSSIVFPGKRLDFNNGFTEITDSVRREFPAQTDNFVALDRFLREYGEATSLHGGFISGRQAVEDHIKDPVLADMLLCPLMYYGSAVENDIDLGQLALLYRSIYHEGFCRPGGKGICEILDLLKNRFLESGGELRMSCEVEKICSENGKVTGVVTEKGEFIAADNILSSAGAPETMALCDIPVTPQYRTEPGSLAFVEAIAVMDQGFDCRSDKTVIFFNDRERFDYRSPADRIDTGSGVVCLPFNFRFEPAEPHPARMIRLTALAGYPEWKKLAEEEYKPAKKACTEQALATAQGILGCESILEHARFTDTITPLTLERFTGRINGAIYGSAVKLKDGKTHLQNLYVCGTDQGFLGITGAMLSGISIANQYMLA